MFRKKKGKTDTQQHVLNVFIGIDFFQDPQLTQMAKRHKQTHFKTLILCIFWTHFKTYMFGTYTYFNVKPITILAIFKVFHMFFLKNHKYFN